MVAFLHTHTHTHTHTVSLRDIPLRYRGDEEVTIVSKGLWVGRELGYGGEKGACLWYTALQ